MEEPQELYSALYRSLEQFASENSLLLTAEQLKEASALLRLEKPPQPELGDWACPCFPLAKIFRQSPSVLVLALAAHLRLELVDWNIECAGAYLNFHLPRAKLAANIIKQVALPEFGCNNSLQGQKIMLEFSSPNTNKPLHLGHLRNNILGEAISRILVASGAELQKVNLINDRGVHICKAMLAYERFAGLEDNLQQSDVGLCNQAKSCEDKHGKTKHKGDHIVGDYYVRFNQWNEQAKTAAPESEDPEQLAQELLRKWEDNDPKVRQLWQKLRQWVLDGISQTYRRCNISFDRLYFESETYQLGKELVAEGLKRGIFTRREDNAVLIDLSEYQLDEKIVQRGDGTSVYITQDLGTAVARHRDFPFDRHIYVVGNEQDYHFKVLFQILRLFGYSWSEHLYHLSYGMVTLPEGKMKSREGTVVDADILLDQLEELALQGLHERNSAKNSKAASLSDNPDLPLKEALVQETAQKIALAALHFYLLQFNPQRDISFNPKESLAFVGNTGPYLQYVGARIHSILKKANACPNEINTKLNPQRLASYSREAWAQLAASVPEWQLLKGLSEYPNAVKLAAAELNPSYVVKALAEIARCFSRFYHDIPVLDSPEPLLSLRLDLCRATLHVLKHGMQLCVIPFLESM